MRHHCDESDDHRIVNLTYGIVFSENFKNSFSKDDKYP